MSKFKAGDKVKIKKGLVIGEYYKKENGETLYFNSNMRSYCGKVVTIERVCASGCEYRIVEDGGAWYWSVGMFENPVEEYSREINSQEFFCMKIWIGKFLLPSMYLDRVIVSKNVTIAFFTYSGKQFKIVSKCREDDKFDLKTGVEACTCKATRKIVEKKLKTF